MLFGVDAVLQLLYATEQPRRHGVLWQLFVSCEFGGTFFVKVLSHDQPSPVGRHCLQTVVELLQFDCSLQLVCGGRPLLRLLGQLFRVDGCGSPRSFANPIDRSIPDNLVDPATEPPVPVLRIETAAGTKDLYPQVLQDVFRVFRTEGWEPGTDEGEKAFVEGCVHLSEGHGIPCAETSQRFDAEKTVV